MQIFLNVCTQSVLIVMNVVHHCHKQRISQEEWNILFQGEKRTGYVIGFYCQVQEFLAICFLPDFLRDTHLYRYKELSKKKKIQKLSKLYPEAVYQVRVWKHCHSRWIQGIEPTSVLLYLRRSQVLKPLDHPGTFQMKCIQYSMFNHQHWSECKQHLEQSVILV